MTQLRAFHGDPAVKQKYLARVAEHARLDEIVQGTGYEKNGKVRACAVGCTLDAYDHSSYPVELGLPVWLAHLEDVIHEGLTLAEAKKWPEQLLRAIEPGADIEPVRWQLTILRMERLLPDLIANKEAYARECEKAIRGVITVAQKFLRDGFSESGAPLAWSAAANAESAAWSAVSAVWSAARSGAARSAAMSAESAAWTWEAKTLLKLLRACKP